MVEKPLDRVVVHLDPDEFHSTWLGNKAIYRTRMAIADGGELTILAPGVNTFGEDPEIDRLIRAYGYRTSPEIVDLVATQQDLQQNLSAAAHMIHGSSEKRFRVVYCPGALTPEEIVGVGYEYAHIDQGAWKRPRFITAGHPWQAWSASSNFRATSIDSWLCNLRAAPSECGRRWVWSCG